MTENLRNAGGSYDAIVLGAGASGLMFACEAARRGRRILLVDHRSNFGQKLLVSGGGRCNFTNLRMDASRFISENPHFVKSAIARYLPDDIMRLLDENGIGYREEDAGQLFLSGSSRQIFDLLSNRAREFGVELAIGEASRIERAADFSLEAGFGAVRAERLVVATGGLSYPRLGASDLGYRLARRFGHSVVPCRPGLVPFVLDGRDRAALSKLAGISFMARVSVPGGTVEGDCLITHRGLSGPAILRASSLWEEGGDLSIDLFPGEELLEQLESARATGSKLHLKNFLAGYLPGRLASALCELVAPSQPLSSYGKKELERIARALHGMEFKSLKTEGFAKAEVTVGGVSTREVSSKTMESRLCPGLHFIGEVLDVAGDLGGYNLHWAWASAHAAAQSF